MNDPRVAASQMTATTGTVRLTAAQALVRYLAALRAETGLADVGTAPLFGGVFAIFGHGNVAGVGEALYRHRAELPTYRAHNEQAMAHAAIAYAKAHMRRRMMVCTTSIGPGATNLVTAAALAHVNRLPVLFLPGDVFASRAPDPVLQQLEDFHDGGVSANDCLKPVSRYFDRIMHPEQLLTALPRAIQVLTDPALCGPVTLALPQDVQTMAYEYPEAFFTPQTIEFRATAPDATQLARAAAVLREAKRPLLIAGGGVLYGLATEALRAFVETHAVPVAETQAGKGALPWDHPLQQGAIGAVQRTASDSATRDIVVCAAGTLPADLHKLWRTAAPGGYHMEYGYSCMGYEIAGGLGVKMARPDREVIVIVGDGSYLMLNSEIATSVMLGHKLIVVVLDNRGFGCINRLQQACGGAPFNNLLADCVQGPL